jgi:hypothetical protein
MHRFGMAARQGAAAIGSVIAISVFILAPAAAETLRFNAILESEIAAVPKASGRGTASLGLDTETKKVNWRVEYSGLAGSPRALGCGAIDTSSPSILVTNDLASPIAGSKTLTDPEIAALKKGNWACVIDTEGEDDAIGGVLQAAQ